MARDKKRIVILGGGFAGIECARKLEALFRNDYSIEIVLVNEDNFLLFTPLLPQVASGMIETRHAITSIRTILDRATFYEGRVKNIDQYGKIVTLWGTTEKRGISIHYDYLILALGSQTNFFGMSDVELHAYTMKTLNDAVMLRNRTIDMLEQAENETNPILRKSLLTFVIVGAGFAGIETAGELLDLLLDVVKYYPNIRRKDLRVIILEALPNILPGFGETLAKFAERKLEQRGLEIKLKSAVTSFDGSEVKIKKLNGNDSSEAIQTKTLIWTAGVTPVNIIKRSTFKMDHGKIIVNDFLEVPNFLGVFAIGDCANFLNPETKRPYAPTAQLAVEQAKTAAHNLYALMKNREKRKFVYKSKGQMAIIGKRTGIANILGRNIAGFWAWLIWRNVYLSKIPNWDKRLRVLIDWTLDLFFVRDVARLKFFKKSTELEYKVLDEVDDVW